MDSSTTKPILASSSVDGRPSVEVFTQGRKPPGVFVKRFCSVFTLSLLGTVTAVLLALSIYYIVTIPRVSRDLVVMCDTGHCYEVQVETFQLKQHDQPISAGLWGVDHNLAPLKSLGIQTVFLDAVHFLPSRKPEEGEMKKLLPLNAWKQGIGLILDVDSVDVSQGAYFIQLNVQGFRFRISDNRLLDVEIQRVIVWAQMIHRAKRVVKGSMVLDCSSMKKIYSVTVSKLNLLNESVDFVIINIKTLEESLDALNIKIKVIWVSPDDPIIPNYTPDYQYSKALSSSNVVLSWFLGRSMIRHDQLYYRSMEGMFDIFYENYIDEAGGNAYNRLYSDLRKLKNPEKYPEIAARKNLKVMSSNVTGLSKPVFWYMYETIDTSGFNRLVLVRNAHNVTSFELNLQEKLGDASFVKLVFSFPQPQSRPKLDDLTKLPLDFGQTFVLGINVKK